VKHSSIQYIVCTNRRIEHMYIHCLQLVAHRICGVVSYALCEALQALTKCITCSVASIS
jgi:hypothetical protein